MRRLERTLGRALAHNPKHVQCKLKLWDCYLVHLWPPPISCRGRDGEVLVLAHPDLRGGGTFPGLRPLRKIGGGQGQNRESVGELGAGEAAGVGGAVPSLG